MGDKEGLYSLEMKGEKRRYTLRGSSNHSLESLVSVLSDLTGYREEYLRSDRQMLSRMKIGEEREIAPASIGQTFKSTPTFIIKRVS